jgi:hypothetical protein
MAGMVMRPPLRTSRRLIWEAEQETAIDDTLRNANPSSPPHWGSSGGGITCRLGADSLFDKKFRRNNSDQRPGALAFGDLAGKVKCNVFVGDLCVRAGFKTFIHEIDIRDANHVHLRFSWHTIDAGSFCNLARTAIDNSATLQLTAVQMTGIDAGNHAGQWGAARTRMLTSVPPADAAAKQAAIAAVNRLISEEGRVIIVAGARRRKGPANPLPNAQACTGGQFAARSGHIVFMESLQDFTTVATNDPGGQGLPANGQTVNSVTINSAQAQSTGRNAQSPGGARAHLPYTFQLNGIANVAGDGHDFVRIHILEANPGGDPDLLHGLQDLHLQQRNVANLSTALDRARPAHIQNSNQCCQDRFPNQPALGNC